MLLVSSGTFLLAFNYNIFVSLAYFQDCKEFQGELFGICNLFRDLSDKLFTSEIFELNEKQTQKELYRTKQESTKVGSDHVSLKEVDVASSSVSEARSTNDSEKRLTSQPVLKEVGKFDI